MEFPRILDQMLQALSCHLAHQYLQKDAKRDGCYLDVPLANGPRLLSIDYGSASPVITPFGGAYVVNKEGSIALTLEVADHAIYWLEGAETQDALHVWIRDNATGDHVAEATVLLPPKPAR
jgi:hypothetical protein